MLQPIFIEMKEIKLSQKGTVYKGFVALVDDQDYERVNQFRWMVMKNYNNLYAVRWYSDNGKQIYQSMHRFILSPPDKKSVVDHADGNGLNNQRYNIRICTKLQNGQNRRRNKTSSSKYKGVYYQDVKRRKKWRALIYADKKRYDLGYYSTPEEAAIAYNIGAVKYHGNFASLNKIE